MLLCCSTYWNPNRVCLDQEKWWGNMFKVQLYRRQFSPPLFSPHPKGSSKSLNLMLCIILTTTPPSPKKRKKLSVQRCASCISSVPHLLPLRKSLILSVSSCQVFKEEIQFQLPFMLWLFWCNNSGSPSLLGALSLPTETFPRFTFSWRPQPTHNMIRSGEYLEKFLKREERELAQEIVWKGEYLEGRLLPNSCPLCWVFGLNKDGFSVCCCWHVLKDGQTHGRKQMLPT